LVLIELQIIEAHNKEFEEGLDESSKENLEILEQKKRKILADRDIDWQLKSRALWHSKGDDNNKKTIIFLTI
jgi:hypothetical protein